MNPLNNPRVEILEGAWNGDSVYDVFVDAKLLYMIERQPKSPFLWLLKDVVNFVVLDQDQYRIDLFERIATRFPAKDIKS